MSASRKGVGKGGNNHKGNKTKARAGKRKCKRCKKIWNKPKGLIYICDICRTQCARCRVTLTEENRSACFAKRGCARCKQCTIEINNNSDSNNGLKKRGYLLRSYGITANEYDEMLKSQNGVCWICQNPPAKIRLSVDHLHSKGENKRDPFEKRGRVRGLLCWRCNGAIGKFKDNIALLRRAADYLETWPAQKILKKET